LGRLPGREGTGPEEHQEPKAGSGERGTGGGERETQGGERGPVSREPAVDAERGGGERGRREEVEDRRVEAR
jgi:hypothetical protein